jgi:hypothetical protein
MAAIHSHPTCRLTPCATLTQCPAIFLAVVLAAQDAASKVGMELTVLGLGKDFIGHGMKLVLLDEFMGGRI